MSFHCILLLLHSALGVMERYTCLLSASHDSRFDLKLVCVSTKHLITCRFLLIKRSHGIIVTLFFLKPSFTNTVSFSCFPWGLDLG